MEKKNDKCYPALLQLSTTKAQTLSRLILNRSSLKAVLLVKDNPHAPINEMLCTACSMREPETVIHTLTRCPLLWQYRKEFIEKIKALNIRLEALKSSHSPLYSSHSSDDILHMHAMLCATHIVSTLSPSQKRTYFDIVSIFVHYLTIIRAP